MTRSLLLFRLASGIRMILYSVESCAPACRLLPMSNRFSKILRFQVRDRIVHSKLLSRGDCSVFVHVALVMPFFVVMIVVRRVGHFAEIYHREQRKY